MLAETLREIQDARDGDGIPSLVAERSGDEADDEDEESLLREEEEEWAIDEREWDGDDEEEENESDSKGDTLIDDTDIGFTLSTSEEESIGWDEWDAARRGLLDR